MIHYITMKPDFLQLLFAAVLIGTLTAVLAKRRGRDPAIWFLIGMLCGIFGLIALFFFPEIKQQEAPKVSTPPPAPAQDALATKKWFYLDAERQTLGPHPITVLQELFKAGTITPSTFVWCDGMEGWKKIQDLPELQSRLVAV